MGNKESTPPKTPESSENKHKKKKKTLPKSLSKPCLFEISAVQGRQIQRIWSGVRAKGQTYVGSSVFHSIFLKAPEVKAVFTSKGTDIHKHFRKFCQELDFVITNLTDQESLSKRLTALGAKHAQYREFGFEPKFLVLFADVMISCTVQWGDKMKRNNETQTAWTKIVLFMIDRMRDGYYKENRKLSVGALAHLAIATQIAIPGRSGTDDMLPAPVVSARSIRPSCSTNF